MSDEEMDNQDGDGFEDNEDEDEEECPVCSNPMAWCECDGVQPDEPSEPEGSAGPMVKAESMRRPVVFFNLDELKSKYF